MKTSELIGDLLDWAVNTCTASAGDPLTFIGLKAFAWDEYGRYTPHEPSTNWSQGGPIIEQEGIELKRGIVAPLIWVAWSYQWNGRRYGSYGSTGPTPLIAAMRCYVTRMLGDEVDVPEELL